MRRYWIICTTLFLILSTTAKAEQDGHRSLYSAVDSLHRASILVDKPVDIVDLLRSIQVEGGHESWKEGWLDRIRIAAEYYGMETGQFKGLLPVDLYDIPMPVILQVRPSLDAEQSDYYVLLEGFEKEQAIITTSHATGMRLPLYMLTPLWNGAGLVVADRPVDAIGSGPRTGRLWLGYLLAGAVGVTALLWSFGVSGLRIRQKGQNWPAITQGCVLLITAGVIAITVSWLGPGRFMSQLRAAEAHEGALLIDFRDEASPVTSLRVDDLTKKILLGIIKEDKPLFVDARSQEEYDTAHIQDGLCLPKFDAATIRLRMAGIPKDQLIIVYCASEACSRGRAASGALMKSGFTNVAHYPPGWDDLRSWEQLELEHE